MKTLWIILFTCISLASGIWMGLNLEIKESTRVSTICLAIIYACYLMYIHIVLKSRKRTPRR